MRAAIVAQDAGAAAGLLSLVPAGLPVEVLLLDPDGSDAAADLPADLVTVVEGVSPATETAVMGRALLPRLPDRGPIILSSSQRDRDLAGWLTITLDAPLIWAIDGLRVTPGGLEADRIVLGGQYRLLHEVDIDGPVVVLGKPASELSDREAAGPPFVERLRVEPEPDRVRVIETSTAADGLAPLAGASVIVSVGRGIGGAQHVPLFAELATRLGAALGASRVAVDAGWLPFSHQVGQTGTSVSPEVYLAFGISGAIQHLAGMRTSRRVVAVNLDPQAPLCQQADLVVADDAVTVARALLDRLQEAKST